MRYLLSKLIPIPMRSTHATSVREADIVEGCGVNHFRDDDHADLVLIKWWQWRGRCFAQRTQAVCIAGS